MALSNGMSLGPYEVVAPLGAGDADRLHRFENEARAAARPNHPNTLYAYGHSRHVAEFYLARGLA